MLSMKIATGVEIVRKRGMSWLSVSFAGPEEVAALEVEEVDEVVDDAGEIRVSRGVRGAARSPQAVGHVQPLGVAAGSRSARSAPVVGGLSVECHHRGVEDLVADRLSEETVSGSHGRTVGVAVRFALAATSSRTLWWR